MLSNKTILIVGASTGIGRAVALTLSKSSNHLIICARNQAALSQLANEIIANGSQALSIPCDALDKISAESTVAQAIERFGDIDIALLNVGQGPSFDMSNASVDQITDNMAINYHSMVNFLIPLITQFKLQGSGIIAHTNSLAGFLGLPKQGPYSAAKAASRLLIDTCRIELKPYGLKFISLYPGFVATDRVLEQNNDMPAPFSISEKIAAQHVIKALSREKPDYLFPLVISALIRFALCLPKSWRNKLLATLY